MFALWQRSNFCATSVNHQINKMFSTIERAGYKMRLMQQCIALIEKRIAANATAITNAQDAANSEEKSSAGDKYETSRAMSHLEKDMHSRQLAANRTELAALLNIDCSVLSNTIKTGSLIQCTTCSFFIAAGLGKINFEGTDVYLLSPNAPLAAMLFKKQQGDLFSFNKMELLIEVVF
jgi:hypothetical protein